MKTKSKKAKPVKKIVKKRPIVTNEDLNGANELKPTQILAIRSPVLSYKPYFRTTTRGSKVLKGKVLSFDPPEYDLAEIARISDVESFINLGNIKKTALMFKQGWMLHGANPDTVTYINKRFQQMELVSNQSMKVLLKEIGKDYVNLHNAILVKVRKEQSSGGKVRKDILTGKTLKPVAAYFRAPPESMSRLTDNYGKCYKWKMEIKGTVEEFNVEDVVHFTYNRKPGFGFGTPLLVPVKADISALRNIEENIELMVHQTIFPILHVTVGNDEYPAETLEGGIRELDLTKTDLENMPAEGGLVTDHRRELKYITPDPGIMSSVDKILDHFLKRMVGGTGLSLMDFGYTNTANRSTSDTLSRQAIDLVKDYQGELAAQVEQFMIRELLLESTFNFDVLAEENLVNFVFNEIDIETKIKYENHGALMYSMHVIDQDEVRRDYFNRKALNDENDEKMFLTKVQEPMSMMQTEGKIEQAKATASIRQRPANQYGTKTGPKKTLKDSIKSQLDLSESKIKARINYLGPGDWATNLLKEFVEGAIKDIEPAIFASFMEGVAVSGASLDPYYTRLMYTSQLNSQVISYIEALAEDIKDLLKSKLKNTVDKEKAVVLAFDSLRYRAQFIATTEIRRAFIWGKVAGWKDQGKTKIQIVPGSSEDPSGILNLDELDSFDPLPPFHPHDSSDVILVEEDV